MVHKRFRQGCAFWLRKSAGSTGELVQSQQPRRRPSVKAAELILLRHGVARVLKCRRGHIALDNASIRPPTLTATIDLVK